MISTSSGILSGVIDMHDQVRSGGRGVIRYNNILCDNICDNILYEIMYYFM